MDPEPGLSPWRVPAYEPGRMVRHPSAPSAPSRAAVCAAALASLALVACVESANATRNQGEDCGSCHRPGGKAPESMFTVSGTVFRSRDGEPRESGAKEVALVLTDARGRRLELRSNGGGNFYSKQEVEFPVRVALRELPAGAERQGPEGTCRHGNCNLCHALKTPAGGARGRLVKP